MTESRNFVDPPNVFAVCAIIEITTGLKACGQVGMNNLNIMVVGIKLGTGNNNLIIALSAVSGGHFISVAGSLNNISLQRVTGCRDFNNIGFAAVSGACQGVRTGSGTSGINAAGFNHIMAERILLLELVCATCSAEVNIVSVQSAGRSKAMILVKLILMINLGQNVLIVSRAVHALINYKALCAAGRLLALYFFILVRK